jgi:hypothetical protein
MIISKSLSKSLSKNLGRNIGLASGDINAPIQYRYLSDGLITIRKGVRSGVFVIDKSLTQFSFNGIEDID